MTEVYGHFLEVIEELNFPADETSSNNNNEKVKKIPKSNKKSSNDFKIDFLNHLFVTLEKVNLSQYESSDSLCSLTSNNSITSMGSQNEIDFENSTEKIFNALQSVTLNTYESANTLCDDSLYNKKLSQTLQQYSYLLPTIVKHFFSAFDDFMHNHDGLLVSKKINELEENNNDFPKLC
jgi:hypothetical protein